MNVFEETESACRIALENSAKDRIARYVIRETRYSVDRVIIEYDDSLCQGSSKYDLLAVVRPGEVYPIGRARHWLNGDGSLNQEYINS